MNDSSEGVWDLDEKVMERGKKLALELLISVREIVPKGTQNEAIAAAVAYLLGKHYSSILELGGPLAADSWVSALLSKAEEEARKSGAEVSFSFFRHD